MAILGLTILGSCIVLFYPNTRPTNPTSTQQSPPAQRMRLLAHGDHDERSSTCVELPFEALIEVQLSTTTTLSDATHLKEIIRQSYKQTLQCSRGGRDITNIEIIGDFKKYSHQHNRTENTPRSQPQLQPYTYSFYIQGYCQGCDYDSFTFFPTTNRMLEKHNHHRSKPCRCNGPRKEKFTTVFNDTVNTLGTNGVLQTNVTVLDITESRSQLDAAPLSPQTPHDLDLPPSNDGSFPEPSGAIHIPSDMKPPVFDNSCKEVEFNHTIIIELTGNSNTVPTTVEITYLESVFISTYNMLINCNVQSSRTIESVDMKQQFDTNARRLKPAKEFHQTYRATVKGRCNGCQGELSTLFDARTVVPQYQLQLCPACPGPTAAEFAFLYNTIFNIQGGLDTVQSIDSTKELPQSQLMTESRIPPLKDPKRFTTIHEAIQESGLTSFEDLTTVGTSQHLALVWLTDYDDAKLKADDDALLQRYGLAVFYFSTFPNLDINNIAAQEKYGAWFNNDYWLSEKGFCDWYGVTCETHLYKRVQVNHYNANGVVVGLNLTENHVRGTIPSELAALENLMILDLGKNVITGTIPQSVMSLKFMSECSECSMSKKCHLWSTSLTTAQRFATCFNRKIIFGRQ